MSIFLSSDKKYIYIDENRQMIYNKFTEKFFGGDIMHKIKVTVIRKARYDDLIEKYENPIEHTCDMRLGQEFISVGGEKPENMCDSAWESMEYFVKELSNGGGNFYDGWMKNKKSAMISCNDGFRPVSFYIEVINEGEYVNEK